MVKLSEIIERRGQLAHLVSSFPRLNKALSFSYGIYDFQFTPVNLSCYEVLVEYILCHMSQGNEVIVLNCLSRFPWNLLVNHPDYSCKYSKLLASYTTDTFSKLYRVISSLHAKTNCLIIVNSIYELLELYKLELSATYEESILKLQIERNATFLSNKMNSTTEVLPNLPPNSDLLQSPVQKFDSHVASLVNNLTTCCQNNVGFVVGNLATNYKQYPRKQLGNDTSFLSQPSQSANIPSTNAGRIVLEPFTYFDNYINQRVVFFRDWYINTGHFKANFPLVNGKVVVNQSLLRWVYGIKVNDQKFYFDNDDGFYNDEAEDDFCVDRSGRFNFIDLTGGIVDEGDDTANRSALFDAIQQASSRLTRSQMASQTQRVSESQSVPRILSDGILETSTQVGTLPVVPDSSPRATNDKEMHTRVENKSVQNNSSNNTFSEAHEEHDECNRHSQSVLENDIPPPSSSSQHEPLTNNSQSASKLETTSDFSVTSDNGVVRIKFSKQYPLESQYSVVEESDDDLIGSLLPR